MHDDAGDVRVLDATSPANPTGLTAWCEAEAAFLDARGVRYDVDGMPVMGAVEGLRHYPANWSRSATPVVSVSRVLPARSRRLGWQPFDPGAGVRSGRDA